MTLPASHFAPNPSRGIYVQGVMDQQMVYRLTPQIVSLQNQSREPITVYIDSPGGLVDYKDAILRLLKASNQNFAAPCRIITVALSIAASAAADLLSSGNYALVYPDSVVMYHGVRVPDRSLTAEEASSLVQRLRASNEGSATELARSSEFRFLFRYIFSKYLFPEVRKAHPGAVMSDLDCFLVIITDGLSDSATKIMRNAHERFVRYDALFNPTAKKWKKGKGTTKKTFVQLEVDQIKAIMEFEVRANKKVEDWNFETEGIHRLTEDFFLLNEYLATFQADRFKALCSDWGKFLLTDEETEAIEKLPEQERPQKYVEKAGPQLRPVWSFFMALCHVLQQGDNHLTAKDAFWLGLVDEIIGVKDLPSLRLFNERAAEVARQEKAKNAQAEANKKEGAKPATADTTTADAATGT